MTKAAGSADRLATQCILQGDVAPKRDQSHWSRTTGIGYFPEIVYSKYVIKVDDMRHNFDAMYRPLLHMCRELFEIISAYDLIDCQILRIRKGIVVKSDD
jgi:hypothetical protein